MIIKLFLSFPIPLKDYQLDRYKQMSSFIQEIKIATTTSIDVIMKNGRAYRYIGIDPEQLLDLISDYAEIVIEGESVGRFYNERIKGLYETEELETTTTDNALDFESVLSNLREGRSILVGNKAELDELLKVIVEHYNVKINYQGLLKEYHSIVGEGCITLRQGELVISPLVFAKAQSVVVFSSIPRITAPIIVADKDSYFYDVTLSSKEKTVYELYTSENETEPLEDDYKPSESENVTDNGKDQDNKKMVLQALNLLEKVIGEKGYEDTDILIKTIRDYIEK